MGSWGCRETLLISHRGLKIESTRDTSSSELLDQDRSCSASLPSPLSVGWENGGQGERPPRFSRHEHCRDQALGENRPSKGCDALLTPKGPVLVMGNGLVLTIARQETPCSDGASFAAKQHPVLPSCFASFIRNFQGPRCSVAACWFLHPSHVAFLSLGRAAYWCSLQSLPENEHNFAFEFLVCCFKLRAAGSTAVGTALCSPVALLVLLEVSSEKRDLQVGWM